MLTLTAALDRLRSLGMRAWGGANVKEVSLRLSEGVRRLSFSYAMEAVEITRGVSESDYYLYGI